MKRVPDLEAEFLRCYKDRRCRYSRGMLTTTILFAQLCCRPVFLGIASPSMDWRRPHLPQDYFTAHTPT